MDSTIPQPSCPGAPGGNGYSNHRRPSHDGRFEPQMPQPSIRTRTWRGPGPGMVVSTISMRPGAASTAARILSAACRIRAAGAAVVGAASSGAICPAVEIVSIKWRIVAVCLCAFILADRAEGEQSGEHPDSDGADHLKIG